MTHKHKYKGDCPDCGQKFKSNWEIGGSSVAQKVLRHRVEAHGYVLTAEEINKMTNNEI